MRESRSPLPAATAGAHAPSDRLPPLPPPYASEVDRELADEYDPLRHMRCVQTSGGWDPDLL